MGSSNQRLFHCHPILSFAAIFLISHSSLYVGGRQTRRDGVNVYKGFGRRVPLNFEQTRSGSNITTECSPSGPCVPCLYSEKSDKKYACSETGYHMPFKCIKTEDGSKQTDKKKPQNTRSVLEVPYDNAKLHVLSHGPGPGTSEYRNLLDDSSASDAELQAYITYISCTTPANQEKLSVLGFEAIVLCLLVVSGSVIHLRRKWAVVTMPGIGSGRIQMNSRS